MTDELTMDVISTVIDRQIFDWLTATAATADDPEQVYAMAAGAVAGLVRYMWVNRKPGTDADLLADQAAEWFRDYARQAQDAEGATVQ